MTQAARINLENDRQLVVRLLKWHPVKCATVFDGRAIKSAMTKFAPINYADSIGKSIVNKATCYVQMKFANWPESIRIQTDKQTNIIQLLRSI